MGRDRLSNWACFGPFFSDVKMPRGTRIRSPPEENATSKKEASVGEHSMPDPTLPAIEASVQKDTIPPGFQAKALILCCPGEILRSFPAGITGGSGIFAIAA